MASSLGVGIACITSVGPRFTLVSEQLCLAHSLLRRLITPRGSLLWAPDCGTDMRDFLNHGNTAQNRFAAQRAAKDECEQDERVESANVTTTFDAASQGMTLTIIITTQDGPFTLIALLTSLDITLLAVNT